MKTALITGASEGLGRCYATKLANEGWALILVARNLERLNSLKSALPNSERHQTLQADLSDPESVRQVALCFETQAIDLLINNAGYSQFGTFREQPLDTEHKMVSVNCLAVMSLAQAFLKQAKSGNALINLSSVTAWLPTPVQPTYVASKAFIKAFSENLWYQEKKRGIYVQALCPGPTRTEFITRAGDVSKADLLNKLSATPDSVINASFKALQKRKKPVVVPGLSNKAQAIFIRLIPRKWAIAMMGLVSDFGLS